MRMDIEHDGPCSIISLSGEVDFDSSPKLRQTLLEEVERGKTSTIIVELSRIEHVDSSCIAVLLEALRAAHQRETRFVLVGLTPTTRHLLELTRLLNAFEIRPSVEDARARDT